MKEISLIIATYNAENTISRCLDSIRKQKLDSVELIIIDGGSKDQTLNIIQQNKDIIDHYISEPDKGIYDAWNKGIKLSNGNWIMFLGADDWLVDDFFDFYLNLISSQNCFCFDIITAKADIVDENGGLMFVYGEKYKWNIFGYRMNISHGTTLHNKSLFSEIGEFDIKYKICGDYDFLLRKKLNALFCDRVMIKMQYGGMSNTFAGLKDSFMVRKNRKTIPLMLNYLVFIRGIISFYYHKLFA